jgi:threonine dehydrogenase-like Zn-dependent dehydrogenase
MRALVLGDAGVELRTDYATPAPRAGEVLVRVLRAGICETDLQLVQGYMRFRGVLGHEFVGIAESGIFARQRVVGEINCSCGGCPLCAAGLPTHCSNRRVLGILNQDGAFADFVSVPERNLHLVPEGIDTDAAVFAEPVAAAFQIPAEITVRPSDRVVILGDGRLGNLCAQVLADMTSHLLVVGKHQRKLDLLTSLGIATTLVADVPRERSAGA